MAKELKYLKKAFDYTGINSLVDFVYEYSYMAVIHKCEENHYKPTDSDLLQLDVFCGGCAIMYKHYIAKKYEISAKTASKKLYGIFPEVFKFEW